MNSETFYAVVRREIGPGLTPCGFRRSSEDRDLAIYPQAGRWIKPLPQAGPPPAPLRLVVSFQHGTWGWLPDAGGTFRMLLEAGPAAEAFELLDDAQWEQVHELQRRIAHKVMRESRVRGRQPELEADDEFASFVRYWDEDDVIAWLTLVRPWVPDLAARLSGQASVSAEFTPAQDRRSPADGD